MQASADQPPTSHDTAPISAVAKGLAHPVRVAIVRRLATTGPSVASDIAHASGLAQSTVSEHLRVLRDAGILSSHREGRRVWYCVEPRAMRGFIRALDGLSGGIPCTRDEVL